MTRAKYTVRDFEMSTLLSIEREFDAEEAILWMSENWTFSIYLSILYVVVIFGIQAYMEKRKKYDLRTSLVVWNAGLAAFSCFPAARGFSEVYYSVVNHGWKHSICNPSCYFEPVGVWGYLFVMSKAYELGDTLFIVLRKQPLIFLHWYHHITVMVYSWYTYAHYDAHGRWFCYINSSVHALMYTYYMFKALRIRVPRWINVTLTTIQTSQMAFGILVNASAYWYLRNGEECHVSYGNINLSFLMYASYFLLFSHYFYQTYINKNISHAKPIPSKPDVVMAKTQLSTENGWHHCKNEGLANGCANHNNNMKTLD